MRSWKNLLALSIAVCVAAPAIAGDGKTTASGIVDVMLSSESGLVGHYLDRQGHPIDGSLVVLSQAGVPVGKTTSNRSGIFHIPSVRQGVYELTLGDQTRTIRAWPAQLAPPAAQPLTVIRDGIAIRSQGTNTGNIVGIVGGLTGITLGIIAIDIAMDAEDDAKEARKEVSALRSP